ncbi:MAG: 4-alpha-glucanotransferase [Pseudonocardiales bacterium]|nr:4-alpha-glucanotransferase [Pseudonocardiales bacterium]
MDSPADLVELAGAYGVATHYWDWQGRHVPVPAETLTAVLAALGVDAGTDDSRRDALDLRRTEGWRRVLPHYVVATSGVSRTVEVHVEHGSPAALHLVLEDGTAHAALAQIDNWEPPREIDGRLVGEASFAVPGDVPVGYHELRAETAGGAHRAVLIVAPAWLGLPERLGSRPSWGLATQLYSVRSAQSWGTGDLADLADLAAWAAEHRAAFVLINPLHAAEPVAPMQPSPYLPTTRRFGNPLYLRVERIPEFAELEAAARAQTDRLAATARAHPEVIDRNVAWPAKAAALELVHRQGLAPGRALAYRAFRRREGRSLEDFATWCALTEVHGPDWHDWPAALRHPRTPEVAAFAAASAGRVDFYRWLQWVLDEQLAATQSTARNVGMPLGIVHDLAVGVSPSGAESWSWQDDMAQGMSVGAPPDPYAQTGQTWQQPPWRPDRLAAHAYSPFREQIRAVLRHAGGLRMDHVMGLFRLWWIPEGASPTAGTYVYYDHEAAVATLLVEAHRAGAVIVGEDLGTVEPWVRDYLRQRGILGTSILWFEADETGGPLPPERWREYCLASVTTHDLPPTAGYLAADHVRLRHRLGLLTRDLDVELAEDAADRDAWLRLARERGLLDQGADEPATTTALHRLLGAAPSRLRCLALTDAVGERRAQNQPGTTDEYPNWRVPLGDPAGRPIFLEDVLTDARAAALADVMRDL